MYRTAAHLSILSLLLLLNTALFSADFYQWTDENGVRHFSDSLSSVPQQYRSQTSEGRFDKESPKTKPTQDLLSNTQASPKKNDLKTYSIPYTAFEGATSRVIVDVTFNGRTTVPMVLDTGAGEVIISENLAKKLGIFGSETAKLDVSVSGFGGTAPAIRTILDVMEIGDIKNHFIPTRVVPPLSKAFEGVVGMNFMSNYHVRINPLKQVVIFEEVQKKAPRFAGRSEQWWRRYFSEFQRYQDQSRLRVASIKRFLRENQTAFQSIIHIAEEELRYAESQSVEAEKLLEKLTRYASRNQVPTSWRRLVN